MEITVQALANEALADEKALNEKYMGKRLRVTGEVTGVVDNWVHIGGDLNAKGESCRVVMIARDPAEAKSLVTWAPVTLEGEFQSWEFQLGILSCVNCQLVGKQPAVDPSSVVSISAEELTKQIRFLTAESVREKYKGKSLQVKGRVEQVLGPIVYLYGQPIDGKPLMLGMTCEEEAAQALKADDMVTIEGVIHELDNFACQDCKIIKKP